MESRNIMQPDRASPARISEVEQPRMVAVDSLSSGWTDEKHNLYLSSIEATFVKQLYGREHVSSNLSRWFSKTQNKANPSQLNPSKQKSGQFKVMSQGCWENLKFVGAKSREAIAEESCYLLANPWVQHFKLASIGKRTQTSVNMDNDDFSRQSINLNSQMEVRKTSSKQLPVCHTLMYYQDLASSRAEVSDQNFVDTGHELAEGPGNARVKKRSRRTPELQFIDQIVPCSSFSASSPKDGIFLKERAAEIGSSTKQQKTDGSSCHNNLQEIKGLGFIMDTKERLPLTSARRRKKFD
ncbi:hypothetical protein KSP40_PGU011851 [Platanthera guangdongensis]|uniref:Uncharacterized protein n=1 Tax=Platanthera guangdongensis TaxID=2320717 RepID=A0ABR2LIP3_9ASPA